MGIDQEKPVRYGVYILPNLFTTASLFAGFFSMILAMRGNMEGCALAILFSAIMDGLDGKVARLTHSASDFGIQYDSLCDLVAFGAAPAFAVWIWQLHSYGKLGIAAAFLLLACGALRLARFNISTAVVNKRFFVGLPIPMAGCTLSWLILFMPWMPHWMLNHLAFVSLLITVILALLMVSRIRYFSFKDYGFFKAHTFSSLVTVLLIFVLIVCEPRLICFLLCLGYLLSGPIYTFILLPRRNRQLLRSLTQN